MMLTRGTRSRRGSRGCPRLHGRGAQRGGRAAAAAAPAAAPDSAPLDALPPLPGTEPLGAPLDPNEEDDDNLPSLQGGAQAAGSSSSRPAEHTVRRVPRTDLTDQLAGWQQLSEHQHSGTLINAAVAGAAASSPVVLAMPVQSTPPIPAAPPPLHQGSGGPPVLRSLQQVPHLQASDLQGTPPQRSVPPPPLPPYPGSGGAMLPPPPQPRQQCNPPRHTPSAPPITHPPLSPEAQEDEGGQDGEQEAAPEVQEYDPGAALSPSFHSARARGDQRGVKMNHTNLLVLVQTALDLGFYNIRFNFSNITRGEAAHQACLRSPTHPPPSSTPK